MQRVAFFGGSFDPPHVGHVLSVSYALSVGQFDRVLVVPVFEHALGKVLAPFEHRLAMAELAFRDQARVEVSALEQTLPSPNYTLNTLVHLRQTHPDWTLRLLVGSDVLADRHAWKSFDEIVQIAPVFELPRPGYAEHVAVLPDVSSTWLRERLRRRSGRAAQEPTLKALVPQSVLGYIDEQGLYQ